MQADALRLWRCLVIQGVPHPLAMDDIIHLTLPLFMPPDWHCPKCSETAYACHRAVHVFLTATQLLKQSARCDIRCRSCMRGQSYMQ